VQEQEVKSTPILDFLESLGGKVELSDGRKIISNFMTVEEELDSLYNGVGLRDISHSGIIELKGMDVLDYIHRIGTNSTKDLPKEGITRTIFTTDKGRIIDVTTLVNFEDYQMLICSDVFKMKVVSWLNRYIINDDVKVSATDNKYALLEFIGPQSESFVSLICGNAVNAMKSNSFKIFSTEGMIFFLLKILEHKPSNQDKIKFWIIADPGNAKQILKYLNENKGPFNYSLIGEEAYNVYRIENGIPEAPYELNDQYNPHEARLTDIIDFNKGCYIGQEVIARLDTYDKVQRYLSGVIFNDVIEVKTPVMLWPDPASVTSNGSETGILTSAAYSPRLKKTIGLAYIKRVLSEEKTKVAVKNGNGTFTGIVSNLPIRK
jgi:tRNA-modifying protein YgfZ